MLPSGRRAHPPPLGPYIVILVMGFMLCPVPFLNGAYAQSTYPAKPLHLFVPYPPGGGVDLVARVIGRKLNDSLRQSVIIENRGGAAGSLAAESVIRAPADGYTIGIFTSTLIMNSVLLKVNYDIHRDFAPIILFATVPNMLVVHPSLPVRHLQDLIRLVRLHPGELTHATSGAGSVPHLMMELLRTHVPRFDIVNVPYKGNAQALTELLGGQITMHISSMLSATPYISSGRLKPIGVTSAHRSRAAPQVPTFAESGITGYDASSLWGFLAPASTPALIISRLNTEIKKILQMPDVNDSLANQGADISGADPVQYALMMKIEQDKWRKLVEVAHIKAE